MRVLSTVSRDERGVVWSLLLGILSAGAALVAAGALLAPRVVIADPELAHSPAAAVAGVAIALLKVAALPLLIGSTAVLTGVLVHSYGRRLARSRGQQPHVSHTEL